MFEDMCLEESEKSGSFIFVQMKNREQIIRENAKKFPINIYIIGTENIRGYKEKQCAICTLFILFLTNNL